MDSSTITFDQYWNQFPIVKKLIYQWQGGQTRLRFHLRYSDLLVEQSSIQDIENPIPFSTEEGADPECIEWKRWLMSRAPETISIRPIMPERPLIVKADQPWTLPPGLTSSFYVSIPLSIHVFVETDGTVLDILKIPSNTLSNTWFGDIFEGELCYAVKTRATRGLDNQVKLPNRAICVFNVHNQTEKPLPIEKICVRPKHLNIYAGNTALWTNSIQVTAEGEDEFGRLKYDSRTPEIENEGSLILMQKAAESHHESFLRRTFGSSLSIF